MPKKRPIDPVTGKEAKPPEATSAFDLDIGTGDDGFGAGGFDLDLTDDDEGDEEPNIDKRARSSRALVDQTIAERRRREKAALDRLDMSFFFSVVFETRAERDVWLEAHGLKLRSGEYLLPDELVDKLKR